MFTYNNKYATNKQTLNRLVTYDKYSLVTVISLSQANRTKFFSCSSWNDSEGHWRSPAVVLFARSYVYSCKH